MTTEQLGIIILSFQAYRFDWRQHEEWIAHSTKSYPKRGTRVIAVHTGPDGGFRVSKPMAIGTGARNLIGWCRAGVLCGYVVFLPDGGIIIEQGNVIAGIETPTQNHTSFRGALRT